MAEGDNSSGSNLDPFYEFDAPKFHDFAVSQDVDDDVDSWFDAKESDEEGEYDKGNNLFEELKDIEVSFDGKDVSENNTKDKIVKKENNSLKIKQVKPEVRNLAISSVNCKNINKSKKMQGIPKIRKAIRKTFKSGIPVVKNVNQKKKAPVVDARQRQAKSVDPKRMEKFSLLANKTTKAFENKIRRVSGSKRKFKRTGKLTMPKSPKLNTTMRSSTQNRQKVLSQEERELKEIEKKKEEAMKRRKLNAMKVQKVLQTKGKILPCRSTKTLTTPREFKFLTVSRKRNQSGREKPLTPAPKKVKTSTRFLNRPMTAPSKNKHKSLTKPRPFNFRTDKRIRPHEDSEKTRTSPLDYGKTLRTGITISQSMKHILTTPKSPKLNALLRKRAKPLSTAEKEILEIESMPNFKAQPFTDSISQSHGDLGVPRIIKKKPTEFKEFSFKTESRYRQKTPKKVLTTAETPKSFKAKKLNRAIFRSGNIGVPKVAKKKPTKPISPPITKPSKKLMEESEPTPFKARPFYSYPTPEPVSSSRKVTSPEPFELHTENRGKIHEHIFKEKLDMEEHESERKRKFLANPLTYDPRAAPPAPEPSEKPLTLPEPFQLKSVELSEKRKQKIMEQLKQEEEEQQLLFNSFRARKPVSLNKSPFYVKKSEKPMTNPEPFDLHTEHRTVVRKQFDMYVNEKQQERENIINQQENERRTREENEIKMLRKQLVHKPVPIIKGKPVDVKKSDKPLTVPVSPQFSVK